MWFAGLIEMFFSLEEVVLGESCLSLPKKQVPKSARLFPLMPSHGMRDDGRNWETMNG